MKTTLLFLYVFLSVNLFGQTDKTKALNKNTINFNAGWSIIVYSANLDYERLIPSKKRNIYSTLSIGAGLYEVNFLGIDQYFFPSLHYGIISRLQSNHHFDVKAGIVLALNRMPSSNDNYLAPSIKAGYRYQVPNERFVFKAGAGFPDIIYFGFGLSF